VADDVKTGAPAPLRKLDAPLAGADQDVLFKAQMTVANTLLGYWKHGVTALFVLLLLTFAVGQWLTHQTQTQREAQAAIARVDQKMPELDPLARMGLTPMDDPNDPARMSLLAGLAAEYEAVAADSDGTARAMAWMRAAESWRRAGQLDKAKAAYQQIEGDGVLGYTGATGVAALAADAGDVDGAVAALRPYADAREGFLAQQALLEIASIYEGAQRPDDARKALEELKTRFPDSSLRLPTARQEAFRILAVTHLGDATRFRGVVVVNSRRNHHFKGAHVRNFCDVLVILWSLDSYVRGSRNTHSPSHDCSHQLTQGKRTKRLRASWPEQQPHQNMAHAMMYHAPTHQYSALLRKVTNHNTRRSIKSTCSTT
jgi:tetratricopeptide (TPR) repeat protein